MKLSKLIVLASLLAASNACDPEEEDSTSDADTSEDGSDPEKEPDPAKDQFCVHAWAGFEARNQFGDMINEVSLGEVPASKIQENGALAVEYAEDFRINFEAARDHIVEDEARLAFEVMLTYEDEWMTPQAQLARNATSNMQYGQDSLELLLQEGVAELTAEAALQSSTAAAYTIERCGSLEAR